LGPNDFWLFQKIKKSALNGQRFRDIEDIQKDVTTALKAVPQQEFLNCFQQWQHRWTKCIAAEREYWKVTPLSKMLVYRYGWNKIIPGTS
jgi:hypothetical protein